MENDKQKFWNSIEIYNCYLQNKGTVLLRRDLVTQLSNAFGKELVVLSSPGFANIIGFKKYAGSMFNLVEVENNLSDMSNIVKNIKKEVQEIPVNRNVYEKKIDVSRSKEDVSETLRSFLSLLSDELDGDKLPAILIGNMITSILSKRYTQLLLSLGLLIFVNHILQ